MKDKKKKLKLLGYLPKDPVLGYWKSNDKSLAVLKTKKEAIEYTGLIRAYFKVNIEYLKVYIEKD